MADSISPVYVGEEAAGFVSASLLSGDTLGQGAITVLPNVSYKVNLKKFDLTSSSVRDASCDFDDYGDVNYAEKALTPEGFAVNKQLCKLDWLNTYAGSQMNVGVNSVLPSSFEEYIISNIGAVVGADVETSIWQGATSNNGEFDGFQTQFLADSDVNDVAGTTLSATNIVEELGKVRDAIPAAIYGKEDLAIYVGTNAFKFYVSAQAALGYLNQFHAGVTEANFEGIKIIACSGLSDDTMVAARKSNLFFATDLSGDMTEVRLLDMADKDGSDNVRVIMKWNAGVGYAYGSEVVFYYS